MLVHCASGNRADTMLMMHLGAEQRKSGHEMIEKAGAVGSECGTPDRERLVHGYVDRGND